MDLELAGKVALVTGRKQGNRQGGCPRPGPRGLRRRHCCPRPDRLNAAAAELAGNEPGAKSSDSRSIPATTLR